MKRCRIIVASVLVLIVSAFLGLHLRNRAQEQRYQAAVRELAEAGQLGKLVGPPLPETKAEQDELDRLTDRIEEVLPASLRDIEMLVPVGTNRFHPAWSLNTLRPWFSGSYDWDQLEASRLRAEEFVGGIRDLVKRDRARSWIASTNLDGAMPSFPHIRNRVRCLAVLAQLDLHRLENARAVERMELMLRESERFRNDPTLVQAMIRVAAAGLALETVASCVGVAELSDVDLARLQIALARSEWISEIPMAVAKERANAVAWTSRIRTLSTRQRASLLRGSDVSIPEYLRGVFSGEYRAGPEQAEAAIRFMNRQVETARTGVQTPENLRALESSMNRLMPDQLKLGMYAIAIPRYGNAVQSMVRLECLRRMTIVRIALERFRLSHGRFPESLADVSGGLAGAEVDPLSGKPFRYRLGEDGRPQLHSVGANGTDENGAGDVIRGWKESNDWPLPQVIPATETSAEAQ